MMMKMMTMMMSLLLLVSWRDKEYPKAVDPFKVVLRKSM
jgi:hypothetical protein